MAPNFLKFENVTQLSSFASLYKLSQRPLIMQTTQENTLTYVVSSLEISCSNSAATILFWSPPTSKVLTCAGSSTLLTLHRFLPIHCHIVSYNQLTLGHSQNLWKNSLFGHPYLFHSFYVTWRLIDDSENKRLWDPFYRQSEEVISLRKTIPVESNSRGRFHINSFVTLK